MSFSSNEATFLNVIENQMAKVKSPTPLRRARRGRVTLALWLVTSIAHINVSERLHSDEVVENEFGDARFHSLFRAEHPLLCGRQRL